VTVSVQSGEGWEPLGTAETGADGVFRLQADAVSPGPFLASAGPAQSEPVALTIPATYRRCAGNGCWALRFGCQGASSRAKPERCDSRWTAKRIPVRLSPTGTFSARVTDWSTRPRSHQASPRAAGGYAGTTRTLRPRIAAPNLRLGSGAAVLFLERQLVRLGYVLLGVNSRYSQDTADAVRLPQLGVSLARAPSIMPAALTSASRPRARVANGDHIEVYKTRQVLFEVSPRAGGAGRARLHRGYRKYAGRSLARVYSKQPGYNAIGMYYSLYFLRGFAIHEYSPVPPYPASHGCVRCRSGSPRGSTIAGRAAQPSWCSRKRSKHRRRSPMVF
jgi:hypothetical protein